MKKISLLDGMSLIDDQYVLEADQKGKKVIGFRIMLKAAAALFFISVLLPNLNANIAYAMYEIPVVGIYFRAVTIREYRYSSGTKEAEVEVPQISMEGTAGNEDAGGNAAQGIGEVNADVQEKADALIAEFESDLRETYADAYEYLKVSYDVILDNEQYYTLRLYVVQIQADSYEWSRYYTISKKTGNQLLLRDLFWPDANYVEIISGYIIEQMRTEMASDENKRYWVNEEFPEDNFSEISEKQQFFISESGEIVICFDEGEVAPMYMGSLQFTISKEIVADILVTD